jgi:hypothetical protein
MRLHKTLLFIGCAAGILIPLSGCGTGAARQSTSPAPLAGSSITVDAVPVPLNPQNPSNIAIGDFSYAGGLVLTSQQTDQLHGLSDLEVTNTDRLAAVSDLGVFLDARLVLNGEGRLVALAAARLTPVTAKTARYSSTGPTQTPRDWWYCQTAIVS